MRGPNLRTCRSPRPGSAGRGGGRGGGGGESSAGCHKPRRVEAFGLGELRRGWSSSSSSSTTATSSYSSEDHPRSSSSSSSSSSDDRVDSPAVAVAASSHHTLVLTRTGRLFAFGYGKSGRLGVGDTRNRILPARVLGRLTRRVVTGVAAAEDHSLCCTVRDLFPPSHFFQEVNESDIRCSYTNRHMWTGISPHSLLI